MTAWNTNVLSSGAFAQLADHDLSIPLAMALFAPGSYERFVANETAQISGGIVHALCNYMKCSIGEHRAYDPADIV